MAASTLPLLLLGYLLIATASARPCKTLFYFSAISTTTYFPHYGNPNNPNSFQSRSPRHIPLFFTSTTNSRFPNHHHPLNFEPVNKFNEDSGISSSTMASSDFPLKIYSSVSSSAGDRTRDILSVVGGLLFGVGCGALTGAALYSVWALFTSRGVDFYDVSSSSSDDDDDADDDVTVAKKFGYVAIPTKPKMIDDDLKMPAPPAKEAV